MQCTGATPRHGKAPPSMGAAWCCVATCGVCSSSLSPPVLLVCWRPLCCTVRTSRCWVSRIPCSHSTISSRPHVSDATKLSHRMSSHLIWCLSIKQQVNGAEGWQRRCLTCVFAAAAARPSVLHVLLLSVSLLCAVDYNCLSPSVDASKPDKFGRVAEADILRINNGSGTKQYQTTQHDTAVQHISRDGHAMSHVTCHPISLPCVLSSPLCCPFLPVPVPSHVLFRSTLRDRIV